MPSGARAYRSAPAGARGRACRRVPEHVAGCPSMSSGVSAYHWASMHIARQRARRPASAHVVRHQRCPAPSARRSAPGISPDARACRPAAAHVVRHQRMLSGTYDAFRSASAHVVRRPANRPMPARVARRLRISLGARAFPSEPADDPAASPRAPREQKPLGGGLVGAGHLWTPRTPPTPPPDPRRATHRAPEPAQVVPGPGQGRGGVSSRPACVTRAAAPPPPCPGWSPRRRESAGTRRCAGGATHGRPRA